MDFSKLRGRIIEKFRTGKNFAEAMGMSTRTLSMKLNGCREFKPTEIVKALSLLELKAEDVQVYFFTLKVQ
jgi:transcriptional antiterminator